MKRIVFIAIAALSVVVVATLGRFYLAGMNATTSQSVGKASIGGPFQLTDHTGKTVTDKDYRGKYMLIYFGYTFCPDVCPTSLGIMGDALDMLNPKQLDQIVPIFVSVDPDRDTPEVLADYVPNFHDKIIGMTGTHEQVKAAARAYKAFYAKVNEDDPDGNYLMDHSSITYLMGPDGQYAKIFSHATPAEQIVKGLAEFL